MNKIQLFLGSAALLVLTGSATLIKSRYESNPAYLKLRNDKSKEESEEIQGARNYYRQITANQVSGEISPAAVQAAKDDMNSMFNSSFKKTRAFANMSWGETGPNNVGGRSRIMCPDRTISGKLYMGAVGGGFWSSTNNGNSWTKRSGNDSSTAIAVSCIAQATNGDIYYGTGEGIGGWAGVSFGPQIFQLGEGIFKSTDGGVTFNQLTATKPANLNSATDQWSYVNKIVTDPLNPDRLFAATYGGLKVSSNGGTSWAKPTTLNTSAHFLDVEISTDGNKVFACTGSNLYVSNDGGSTFSTNIMGQNGLPTSGTASRIEIAVAPSDPNYVYLTIAAGNGSLKGVYKSTNGGASWTTIGVGGGIFNPLGNQGDYDIAFSIHPTNKDMAFLGGQLELVRYTPSNGWETISFWLANIAYRVHADMHCITFNPNDPENMYVANDGGFYRTFNASAPQPNFAEQNKNYSVTQCYGVAANFLGSVMFGSQDNGTGVMGEEVNSPQEARDLTGGDGTRCAMSDYFPNFLFSSIVNGDLRRAADGGQNNASFKSFFDKNIDANLDGSPEEAALWVSPIDFKERKIGSVPKSVFLFCTSTSVWMTQSALKGNSVWFRLYSPGAVGFSALTMAKDGKTVFAATQNGNVYRIAVPSLWDSTYQYSDTVTNMPPSSVYGYPLYSSCVPTLIGTYSGRFVTDVSCDSTGDVVLVTLGNYGNSSYIYKSTDAKAPTPTFTDITSNLPKMPVYTSLCLYGSGSKFMIGSELGIWGTDNGGTTWTELNLMNPDPATWHPRVATYEIIEKDLYDDRSGGSYSGSIIYTGTHGRGTFRSTSLSNYLNAPTTIHGVGDNKLRSLSVYPNPANSQMSLEYTATASSKATVRVYSLTGTMVKELNITIAEGLNKIPMDVSTLSSGGYVVSLLDGGNKASTSFIKN